MSKQKNTTKQRNERTDLRRREPRDDDVAAALNLRVAPQRDARRRHVAPALTAASARAPAAAIRDRARARRALSGTLRFDRAQDLARRADGGGNLRRRGLRHGVRPETPLRLSLCRRQRLDAPALARGEGLGQLSFCLRKLAPALLVARA